MDGTRAGAAVLAETAATIQVGATTVAQVRRWAGEGDQEYQARLSEVMQAVTATCKALCRQLTEGVVMTADPS